MFPEAAEGRELIGDIIARIDSLNVVVSDLLTFARVRALRRGELDLRAFLIDITASLRLDPELRHVEVSLTGASTAIVDADPDQLRVAITNLILNAAQAMDHRGRSRSRSATGTIA